jgi:hypothetical protein
MINSLVLLVVVVVVVVVPSWIPKVWSLSGKK